MAKEFYYQAIGRRKEARAVVKLKPGEGKLVVNGKTLEVYFPRKAYTLIIQEPLQKVDFLGRYDIEADVKGGGLTGQAEAIKLGIARNIIKINPELRTPLKSSDLLTRDPRIKERKKPGLRGARAKPQSSKR